MEMARRKGPCYYALRENQAVFDGEFGKGAWKAYTATKKQPKTGKPVPAPLSRLVPWRVRPFIVEGGKTLAQQLEKDRSDSMARASKKFYVGYNETLLEALQREFDVWTTGISIRAAKPGEFTVTSGTGITFG